MKTFNRLLPLLIVVTFLLVGCSSEKNNPRLESNPKIGEVIVIDSGETSLSQNSVGINITKMDDAIKIFDTFTDRDAIETAYAKIITTEHKSIWFQPLSVGCLPPLSVEAHFNKEGILIMIPKINPMEANIDCVRAITSVGIVAVN